MLPSALFLRPSPPRRRPALRAWGLEALESRTLLHAASPSTAPLHALSSALPAVALGGASPHAAAPDAGRQATAGLAVKTTAAPAAAPELSPEEVQALLTRASGASSHHDAIIAVVDRGGRILGVRVEGGVSPTITASPASLTFAVDGAVSLARTAAFFANDQAPLTSRTIQDISQSTITQREVQSSPDVLDPNSSLRGPGFVAPIGLKGHFPPRVMFTPQVDLFQIEHTNRDSIVSPGPDHIRGTADDIRLPNRFNADPAFVPPGAQLSPPESYGFVSGIFPAGQSRGVGTLPGGIPIVRFNPAKGIGPKVIGGIGVFFPGTTGYATEENSKLNDAHFFDPTRPDRSEEAEFIAFAAVGGSRQAGVRVDLPLGGVAPLQNVDIPFGRIDLVGISLDIVGGHGTQGPTNLLRFARTLKVANQPSGVDLPVTTTGTQYLAGQPVPEGWLVLPHDAPDGTLKAADVTAIVNRSIAEANQVRAAIRLPLDQTARMVFAVSDRQGNILGLYRMPDATVFSIDVAVAKARNVAYYANPAQLQTIDQVPGVPVGTAFTNRTFRYLAEPRFPEGIDGFPPGPFSILNDGGVQVESGRNSGPPLPASAFQSVQGFDAFNPSTNFHDPFNVANQNGIVFFPGSAPLYKDTTGSGVRGLVGGFGVSGDGVDQDDDVTFEGAQGFEPPFNIRRADQVFVRGARLPYQKFNRQPHEPFGGSFQPISPIPKVSKMAIQGFLRGFLSPPRLHP